MRLGTRNHPDVGKRVEIPAWSDTWMRGARYGTVARVVMRSHLRTLDPQDARDIYRVRMDNPRVRRLQGFLDVDCRIIRNIYGEPIYTEDLVIPNPVV